jgi:hypothetical protein
VFAYLTNRQASPEKVDMFADLGGEGFVVRCLGSLECALGNFECALEVAGLSVGCRERIEGSGVEVC